MAAVLGTVRRPSYGAQKWYDERDADSVACILKEGSYIIGPPEQFFDDDWMSYAKSTLPPRSKDKHYIDEVNETYLFRVKRARRYI